MERNYWQDYWDNYYKFVALYLRELQNANPDVDIKNEYLEVASLFEPSMPLGDNDDYDDYDDSDDYLEVDNNQPFTSSSGDQSAESFTAPSGVQPATTFTLPGGDPTPFISPGGGQFTINNCRRVAIVRIVMRRGFTPSNFFMAVDRADRRSIQGFRIACESGRIRFVPMAVEYRNINLIECAF